MTIVAGRNMKLEFSEDGRTWRPVDFLGHAASLDPVLDPFVEVKIELPVATVDIRVPYHWSALGGARRKARRRHGRAIEWRAGRPVEVYYRVSESLPVSPDQAARFFDFKLEDADDR